MRDTHTHAHTLAESDMTAYTCTHTHTHMHTGIQALGHRGVGGQTHLSPKLLPWPLPCEVSGWADMVTGAELFGYRSSVDSTF